MDDEILKVFKPIHQRLDYFLSERKRKPIPYFCGPEHLSTNGSPGRYVWVPSTIVFGQPRNTSTLCQAANQCTVFCWGDSYGHAKELAILLTAAAAEVTGHYVIQPEGQATWAGSDVQSLIKEGRVLLLPMRWVENWPRQSSFEPTVVVETVEEELAS